MRPLEDVRILALEQYGAGPFGTLHLAELGAEVIKIEEPATGGDVARFDTAMSLLTYVGTWYLTAGVEPRRVPLSAHPSLVPFQNFQTATGWPISRPAAHSVPSRRPPEGAEARGLRAERGAADLPQDPPRLRA